MAIPTVAEVRSLSQPLGKPPVPDSDKDFLQRLADQAMRAAADSRYVSISPLNKADLNHITRFDIVFKTDPFCPCEPGIAGGRAASLTTATHPGGPLQGRPDRSGRLDLGGQRPQEGDHRRPAADVRAGDARGLRDPGRARSAGRAFACT